MSPNSDALQQGNPLGKAVVLCSGGIDSTTTLAIARHEGYDVYALTFDYGQRHAIELKAAERVAHALGAVDHLVLEIGLGKIGGSALTAPIEVPKGRPGLVDTGSIPVTYVPARNTIFLSYALAWAEVLEAAHIFIGVTAVDYSGYPDCRPEYIHAFESMANLATRAAVESNLPIHIHAPLISLSKADIIRRGAELGVDYALTHSCYDPDGSGRACGSCDSCLLRKKGFQEAALVDPTLYRE